MNPHESLKNTVKTALLCERSPIFQDVSSEIVTELEPPISPELVMCEYLEGYISQEVLGEEDTGSNNDNGGEVKQASTSTATSTATSTERFEDDDDESNYLTAENDVETPFSDFLMWLALGLGLIAVVTGIIIFLKKKQEEEEEKELNA